MERHARPGRSTHSRRRLLVATTLAIGIVLVSTSTTASVAGDVATKAPGRAAAAATADGLDATPKNEGDSLSAVGTAARCVSERNTAPADPKVLEIGIDVSQQLCETDQTLWSSLYLQAGLTYTISTRHLSVDGDTELSLYSPDGTLLLGHDNNGGTERGASRLVVTASTSAIYLIAVSRSASATPTGPLVYDLRAD
jgi:hypothetical protein